MTAKIISGIKIRQAILEEIKSELRELKAKYHKVPGLATLLIGRNAASLSYVSSKIKTAHELGFHEIQDNQPQSISQKELLLCIEKYNRDEAIHGLLVQLPLPEHIDEKKIIATIDPHKDVDGFHPINVGKLMLGGNEIGFPPCTPAGIVEMLKRARVQVEGAEVVVVGRSNIVGKPIANMLLQKGESANATVTVVHSATRNMESHCRRADILIVAAGVVELVKAEWIKPGACVIDVGVNRIGEKNF